MEVSRVLVGVALIKLQNNKPPLISAGAFSWLDFTDFFSNARFVSGYFEIGIFNLKTPENLGTLWRSAYSCGAAGIFTIGKRYQKQSCDCFSTAKHIPLRSYLTFDDFLAARPDGAMLVAVESGGTPLREFKHPKRALYLLGAEDSGIPGRIINRCNELVTLDSVDPQPYNVAVAGSVVMYDRMFLR